MNRVAAIAIDAAEWWYLEQLMDSGLVPNLARLRDRSASFQLDTPMAYRSELSWTRFLTNADPLEAKEWAASMTFDPATYSIGSTPASSRTPFYAFGPGTKVVTLDLIHNALADGVDGEQVVAWGAHSPQHPRSSRPQGLLTEIDRRFGTSPIYNNDTNCAWHDPDYIEALSDGGRVAVRRRAEIGRWLLERTPDWNLFLTCVSEIHACGHLFWHGVDPASPLHHTPTAELAARRFNEVWRATDEAIGILLDSFPEGTNVIILAHHGMMPADDVLCTVLLPELLLLHHTGRRLFSSPNTAKWRAAGCPPIIPDPEYTIGEYMTDRFADTTRQRVRRRIRNILPRPVFEQIRQLAGRPKEPPYSALANSTGPECLDVENVLRSKAIRGGAPCQTTSWYHRHWPRMPSFALPTFADGHVRINLQGRERDGMVAPDDYSKAIDEVVDLLAACRDARTGRPVLEDAIRIREADPFDPEGPDSDLLIIWDGAADAIEHPDLGVIGPFPHLRTAHHSNRGFALVSGPGIKPGKRGRRSSNELTPTILSLLGKGEEGTHMGLIHSNDPMAKKVPGGRTGTAPSLNGKVQCKVGIES